MENDLYLRQLQDRIGYAFSDPHLLEVALRHSSYTYEHQIPYTACNERLEFLGDAVLELVSSRTLYDQYPDKPEGELTQRRASLVCEPVLADCAREIRLGEALLLGKGEEKTGGRDKASLLCDAFEALIGAIYLDGGLAAAEIWIKDHLLYDLPQRMLFQDAKTILQEYHQKNKTPSPVYQTEQIVANDSSSGFVARVYCGDVCLGEGTGASKKQAEQEAARRAVASLPIEETIKKDE